MSKKAKIPREDKLLLIETQQPYWVLLTGVWSALMSAGLLEGAPGGATLCGSAKACSSLLEINCDLVSIMTIDCLSRRAAWAQRGFSSLLK